MNTSVCDIRVDILELELELEEEEEVNCLPSIKCHISSQLSSASTWNTCVGAQQEEYARQLLDSLTLSPTQSPIGPPNAKSTLSFRQFELV